MNQILVALGSDTPDHKGGLAYIVIRSGSSGLCTLWTGYLLFNYNLEQQINQKCPLRM